MELTNLLVIFGMPLVLVGLFVVPFLRVWVDLADEGYLVFGIFRLRDGQLPIRDFRAYDPGRYYWCGLFTLIFGAGFFAARVTMAVTMALALCLLATLMISATDAPILSVLTCALAMIWMQPRHKQIENFFAILGVFLLFDLSDDGGLLAYATLGAAIGLSAFFGLNCFVYLVGASFLMASLALDLPELPSLSALGLGFALGMLPTLVMFVAAKGYARDYFQRKIWALFQRGSTNLKLPLPWIWATGKTAFDGYTPVRRLNLKGLFSLMPVLFVGGLSLPLIIGASEMSPPERLIFAASCIGLVNFYHILSRADLGHMFLPALPLSVLIAASSYILFGTIGASIAVALALLAAVWLVWQQPFQLIGYLRSRHDLVQFQCATDRLYLPSKLAMQMERLQQVTQKWSTKDEPILSVPMQIGLCAMFDRAHAVYDSFPVYPSGAPARRKMVEDLAKSRPKLMLIGTKAVDQRKDLIFLNNYPQVAAFIATDYTQLETISGIEIYVRSNAYSP